MVLVLALYKQNQVTLRKGYQKSVYQRVQPFSYQYLDISTGTRARDFEVDSPGKYRLVALGPFQPWADDKWDDVAFNHFMSTGPLSSTKDPLKNPTTGCNLANQLDLSALQCLAVQTSGCRRTESSLLNRI